MAYRLRDGLRSRQRGLPSGGPTNHEGARAVLHLTIRAAWHDRAWDGAVCNHPTANAFCLALDRVREERDDAQQEAIAGRHWGDLEATAQPPCRQEAGAFMSAREWTRVIPHPYQERTKARDTHGHLRPTAVKVPP